MTKLEDVWREKEQIEADAADAMRRKLRLEPGPWEWEDVQNRLKERRQALPKKADLALREHREALKNYRLQILKARARASEESAKRWDSARLQSERDRMRGLVRTAAAKANPLTGETKASAIEALIRSAETSGDRHANRALLEAIGELMPEITKGRDTVPMLEISHRAQDELNRLVKTPKELELDSMDADLEKAALGYVDQVSACRSGMPDPLTSAQFFAGERPLYKGLLDGIVLTPEGPKMHVDFDLDVWGARPESEPILPTPTFTENF